MTSNTDKLAADARRAVQTKDWATVERCAMQILKEDEQSAEGHFLAGLVAKTAQRRKRAIALFERALASDPARHDAAVELADLYSFRQRHADAARLLGDYVILLRNSPRYLDLAGTVYSEIGMAANAWPLYLRANELQPGVALFQSNLANCAVSLGRIEEAKAIYRVLLDRHPGHQRNHYHLSRLETATDTTHIEQMLEIVRTSTLQPKHLIFLYYAIGKEYEDLEYWDEAFSYYQRAGDTIAGLTQYDLNKDLDLIETAIEVCDSAWLADGPETVPTDVAGKTPIFVVGLPRTGTTLTERIVSSHSKVGSVGETQYLQTVLHRESGVATTDAMNPAIIRAMGGRDIALVANGYLNAVNFRLGDEPMFIDKLPINLLHLGFIAKAFPEGKIVHLIRHPMDACMAMYKQVFTWVYKFSYTLDGLGQYYVAYDRLMKHWREVLGERLIEVRYEELVTDQERVTRKLLDQLGLDFEEACLDFEKNPAASDTASSVQVRKKIHTGSVDRWRRFERQLMPLQRHLEKAGILPF